MSRFVIAGKKETYKKYIKDNSLSIEDCFYISSKLQSESYIFTENDIIVLLPGWFAKSWAKDFLEETKQSYPSIVIEYLDGKIGESERKNLQSESINSRFDILDFGE